MKRLIVISWDKNALLQRFLNMFNICNMGGGGSNNQCDFNPNLHGRMDNSDASMILLMNTYLKQFGLKLVPVELGYKNP